MTEQQSTGDFRILSFSEGKWTMKSPEGRVPSGPEERPSLLSSAIPPMWNAPVPLGALELTETEKRALPTGKMRLSALLSRVSYGDEKSVTRDTRI